MRDQSTTRRHQRRHTRRNALMAVGVLVVLVLLTIVIDSALYYNKVHAGVKVSTVSLGGLTRDEATAALTRYVAEAQKNPVELTDGKRTWTIMPAEVGTEIDVAGAVSAAMDVTRQGNFFSNLVKRFKLYFSEEQIALQGSVDEALMDKVLEDIAQQIDVPPVNAGLAIEGTEINVIEGQSGLVVDREALRETLTAVLLTLHATEIEIPMLVKEPDIQAEDNQKALEQARTMISAPVKLTSGDKTWSLTPADIAACMDFTSNMVAGVSTLAPYLSAEKMQPFLDNIAPEVAVEPVNATFDSDGTKAWVVPGTPGKELDRGKTAEAVNAAALKPTGRTAEVVVTTKEPDLTTEEAGAMGIRDRLGTYTTEYVGTKQRQVNVRITTKYASDVILAPGDVYNFDKQIGPRTAERGYQLAPGIVGPGKMEDVFGGGICQVSTTLFNAAFFAGLEIVERHNHSIYIDHYPKGRDATVSAGGPNLRFRNDTSHHIWIRGSSDGITTTFSIYGTDDGRKVTYTTSDFYNIVPRTEVTIPNPSLGTGTTLVRTTGQSGKQIKVVRVVTLPDGTVLHKGKDTFISTFPMIPKQIEVGTGTTTTTTTTSTTSTTTTTAPTPPTTTPPTTAPTTTTPPTTSPNLTNTTASAGGTTSAAPGGLLEVTRL